jgi:hypothetical protein
MVTVSALCAAAVVSIPQAAAQTLDKVKQRGSLVCGVNPG